VPEPEELTQSADDDKKLNCDSYLSPTFFSHAGNCNLDRALTGPARYQPNIVGPQQLGRSSHILHSEV
jgi:hypothetical protein